VSSFARTCPKRADRASEAGGYTPSDFQERGLSQSVIDMLTAGDDEDE
jgi:hypothetical protein